MSRFTENPLLLFPLRLELYYESEKKNIKIRWYPDDIQVFPHITTNDEIGNAESNINEQINRFYDKGFDLKCLPEKVRLYTLNSNGNIDFLCEGARIDQEKVKLASPDTEKGKWLEDFRTAVENGMGVEFSNKIKWQQVEKAEWLIACGYKDNPESIADELFSSHQKAGKLRILFQDEPTNNTEKAKVEGLRKSDEQIAEISKTNPSTENNSTLLSKWLGLSQGIFNTIEGGASIEHGIVPIINQLIWPVGSQHNKYIPEKEKGNVGHYFKSFVSGRGTLPGVRVNDNPYGFIFTSPGKYVNGTKFYESLERLAMQKTKNMFLAMSKTHGRTLHNQAVTEFMPSGFSAANLTDWKVTDDITWYSPIRHDETITSFDRLEEILRQNAVSERIDLLLENEEGKIEHKYLNEFLITTWNDSHKAIEQVCTYLKEVRNYLNLVYFKKPDDIYLIPKRDYWLSKILPGELQKFDNYLSRHRDLRDPFSLHASKLPSCISNRGSIKSITQPSTNQNTAIFSKIGDTTSLDQLLKQLNEKAKTIYSAFTSKVQSAKAYVTYVNGNKRRLKELYSKEVPALSVFTSFYSEAYPIAKGNLHKHLEFIQSYRSRYPEIEMDSTLSAIIMNAAKQDLPDSCISNLLTFSKSAQHFIKDLNSLAVKLLGKYGKLKIEELPNHIRQIENNTRLLKNDLRNARTRLNEARKREQPFQNSITELLRLQNKVSTTNKTYLSRIRSVKSNLLLGEIIDQYSSTINNLPNKTTVSLVNIKNTGINSLKNSLKHIFSVRNEIERFNADVNTNLARLRKLNPKKPAALKEIAQVEKSLLIPAARLKLTRTSLLQKPTTPTSIRSIKKIGDLHISKQNIILKNKSIKEMDTRKQALEKELFKLEKSLLSNIGEAVKTIEDFERNYKLAIQTEIKSNKKQIRNIFNVLLTAINPSSLEHRINLIDSSINATANISTIQRSIVKDEAAIGMLTFTTNTSIPKESVTVLKKWFIETGTVLKESLQALDFGRIWRLPISSHPFFSRLLFLSANHLIFSCSEGQKRQMQNNITKLIKAIEMKELTVDNLKSLVMESIDCFSHRADAWHTGNSVKHLHDRLGYIMSATEILMQLHRKRPSPFNIIRMNYNDFLTCFYHFIQNSKETLIALSKSKNNSLKASERLIENILLKWILNSSARVTHSGLLTQEEKTLYGHLFNLISSNSAANLNWANLLKNSFNQHFNNPSQKNIKIIIAILKYLIEMIFRASILNVGVFGWLEKPVNTNKKSNHTNKYFQAPSLNQAKTTAILKAASIENKAQFNINLSAERINKALWFYKGLEKGLTVAELLGYQAERLLHEKGADLAIHVLREVDELCISSQTNHPIYTTNRLINGEKLAEIYNASARNKPDIDQSLLDFKNKCKLIAKELELGTFNKLLDKINETGHSLVYLKDAVADLSIAETVFQHINGNDAKVAAWLEAAEGKLIPPVPEVADTPRTGHNKAQKVIYISRLEPQQKDLNQLNPREIAEPALAKICDDFIPQDFPSKFSVTVDLPHHSSGQFSHMIDFREDLSMTNIDLVFGGKEELEKRTILFIWRKLIDNHNHAGLEIQQENQQVINILMKNGILHKSSGHYFFDASICVDRQLEERISPLHFNREQFESIQLLWKEWLRIIKPTNFLNHQAVKFIYNPHNQAKNFQDTLNCAYKLESLLNSIEPIEEDDLPLTKQNSPEELLKYKEKQLIEITQRLEKLREKIGAQLSLIYPLTEQGRLQLKNEFNRCSRTNLITIMMSTALLGYQKALIPSDIHQLTSDEEKIQDSFITQLFNETLINIEEINKLLADLKTRKANYTIKQKIQDHSFGIKLNIYAGRINYSLEPPIIPEHLAEHISADSLKLFGLEKTIDKSISLLKKNCGGERMVIFPCYSIQGLKHLNLITENQALSDFSKVRSKIRLFSSLADLDKMAHRVTPTIYKGWNQAVNEGALEANIDIESLHNASISPSKDEWHVNSSDIFLISNEEFVLDILSNGLITNTYPIAGFKLDTWDNFITNNKEHSAISFNYDAPDAEAPNGILICSLPSNTKWENDNNLPEAIANVIDLMRMRTVTMDDIMKTPLQDHFPFFEYDHKFSSEVIEGYFKKKAQGFTSRNMVHTANSSANANIIYDLK